MLHELISHSPDLKHLKEEGYQIEIYKGYLLVHNVPYVNNQKQVKYGLLASTLNLSGNVTMTPSDHICLWIGDYPCHPDGTQLSNLVSGGNPNIQIDSNYIFTHLFSQKPLEGYQNYYQKITYYIDRLVKYALVIDPDVTAKSFNNIEHATETSIFNYVDTSSSRSSLVSVNEKLKQSKIAIIGLGGTGSYILDLVAKTLVEEIHLFDGDFFFQHNAFRCPGAFSLDELSNRTTKVKHLVNIYSKMRQNIIPHPYNIDESNISELDSMNIVFLSIDDGMSRKLIVEYLIKKNVPFIDTGMGLSSVNNSITGLLRVTTCTSFVSSKQRIPFTESKKDDYSNNIQIADMNALNGTLAVIKWKKMCGFYHDFEHEHNTSYSISTNNLTNEFKNEIR